MPYSERYRDLYTQFLELLMRPFVRFCVRHSLSFQTFVAVAKKDFVMIGGEELMRAGSKINPSRLCVLTGLTRTDIGAIRKGDGPVRIKEAFGVMGRVLVQWEQDRRFRAKSGEPRVLSYEGGENEFRDLVESVGKHVKPGTVLFEMIRSGLAVKTPRGVRLLTRLSQAGKVDDPVRGFELLSRDIDTLITGVEENILNRDRVSNSHLRTQFDNIYIRNLPEVRRWLLEETKALHRRTREFLAKFDKDINPQYRKDGSEEDAGGLVVLGTVSHTTRLPGEAVDSSEPKRTGEIR